MRQLKFSEAIREAQAQCLEDPSVILIGEGVPDPKAVFGTTAGLKEKFNNQVFDMPVSENGMTGVCIGAAINGLKPILVHQRIDFSLYAMDQIVNNAAKWYSMYGGQKSVPMVVRLIVGRGWGQGNQHSQNLAAIYAHIPGLKVVCPSNAYDAKGLLIAAVNDPNPVIFIEHRWLHDTECDVPEVKYEIPIGSLVVHAGNYATIVASGHAYKEAIVAREYLAKQGCTVEIIDLRTIKPMPTDSIIDSVRRTGQLLVVDDGWKSFGVAAEVIAAVAEAGVEAKFRRLTYPDYPSASSPALTKNYYPGPANIACEIEQMLGAKFSLKEILEYQESRTHDVPDPKMFLKGPF